MGNYLTTTWTDKARTKIAWMLTIGSCLLSANLALAAPFDFLPASSGPEKEMSALLKSGNYRQAFLTWGTSYQNTAFAQSQDGYAVWSYLLLKNGLPLNGIETLFAQTQPTKIQPELLALWSTELKASVLVQKGWISTDISTVGGWKSFTAPSSTAVRLRNKGDIARAFNRAQTLSRQNVNQAARIYWQISNRAPILGQIDSAIKALKLLAESGQTAIGQDFIALTLGRVLYQKGELDAALASFERVPKGSSLWVEAVEERAWTHLRKGNHGKATGVILTAMSPALALLTGPESYFLSNLMALQICDYPRVFKTSETFKSRHRRRLNELQTLATTGTNAHLNQALAKFETSGVSQESAGALVEFLPRQLFRDSQFLKSIETRRQILKEIAAINTLVEQGSPLGTDPRLEQGLAKNMKRADQLKQLAYKRLRTLAQVDLNEYKIILNKMHILEAEVMERLHLDDNLKGQRNTLANTDDPKGALVFPYVANEVWMDELDNYEARVKDCPTLKGASL